MFQLTDQQILNNRITELGQRVKILEEKMTLQNQIIKKLQNKLNCLEIDEVIKMNEKY